jgi:very-short-patch-repair endonuclease
MTYPEILLWQRLRGSPGGLRFRRQHPIGVDYVADFYCSSARLVIEVDGETHASPAAQKSDATRDAYMRSRGLDIVRIPAREVLGNADDVANSILSLASQPLHHRAPHDGPPPRAGEEQE